MARLRGAAAMVRLADYLTNTVTDDEVVADEECGALLLRGVDPLLKPFGDRFVARLLAEIDDGVGHGHEVATNVFQRTEVRCAADDAGDVDVTADGRQLSDDPCHLDVLRRGSWRTRWNIAKTNASGELFTEYRFGKIRHEILQSNEREIEKENHLSIAVLQKSSIKSKLRAVRLGALGELFDGLDGDFCPRLAVTNVSTVTGLWLVFDDGDLFGTTVLGNDGGDDSVGDRWGADGDGGFVV